MFRLIGPVFSRPTGFYLVNLMIISSLYIYMTDPFAYFFVAAGVLTFSYFVRRAIRQVVGD